MERMFRRMQADRGDRQATCFRGRRNQMKILIVTGIFPPDPGGPASYVPRIAKALGQRGHSVEVVCLSDRMDHDDSGYTFRVRRIRRGLFWPFRVLLTTFAAWRAAL